MQKGRGIRGLFWCAVVLSFVRPAHASFFGEENVTLGAILAENMKQTFNLMETLNYLRDVTASMRDAAAFSRESIQASKNVHTLMTQPTQLLARDTQALRQAFPEVQDIMANVIDVRLSLDDAAHPEHMANYDPYVYVRAVDRLGYWNASTFEVMAHGADPWDIHGAHDQRMAAAYETHQAALNIIDDLATMINASGLSPVQASVYTAQTSAVSAAANAQAAAALERIDRTQTWQVMHAQERDEATRVTWDRELEAVLSFSDPGYLDPLGRRTRGGNRK